MEMKIKDQPEDTAVTQCVCVCVSECDEAVNVHSVCVGSVTVIIRGAGCVCVCVYCQQ